jgi:hypothetical protein
LFGPSTQLVGAGVLKAGRPRLPMRLMISLPYLKHASDESDERVVERWGETPLWHYFSGMDCYEHRHARSSSRPRVSVEGSVEPDAFRFWGGHTGAKSASSHVTRVASVALRSSTINWNRRLRGSERRLRSPETTVYDGLKHAAKEFRFRPCAAEIKRRYDSWKRVFRDRLNISQLA